MYIKGKHAYYTHMHMIFKRSIRERNTCTTCLQLMAAFTVAESKLKIDLRTRFMQIQGKLLQLYWYEMTFRKVMVLPQYLHLCILQKEWFMSYNHQQITVCYQLQLCSTGYSFCQSSSPWHCSRVYKRVTWVWPVGEWASKQSSSVVSALPCSGTEWKL